MFGPAVTGITRAVFGSSFVLFLPPLYTRQSTKSALIDYVLTPQTSETNKKGSLAPKNVNGGPGWAALEGTYCQLMDIYKYG